MYSIPYEKGIFIPWGETIYGHPQSFDMQLLRSCHHLHEYLGNGKALHSEHIPTREDMLHFINLRNTHAPIDHLHVG